MRTRVIFGCSGRKLTAAEQDFFRDVRPWGFILFARNIENRAQVRALVDEMRACVEDPQAPVFIDQEGGRVARLTPPEWHARPRAQAFAALMAEKGGEMAREAAYLSARLIAYDLAEIGINCDCMPVLDVRIPGAHDVIGDRAYGFEPGPVVHLGRAVIEGLMEGGVLPVMKHIPGHGRAMADSHKALPRVDAPAETLSATDFVPFRALNFCPMAMTAHVVYEAIDPARPATLSPRVIHDVIRGEIGFEGLLMSDDLSMHALDGTLAERARTAQLAGCDVVLHCNGEMNEMTSVASELKPLEGEAEARAAHVLSLLQSPVAFDPVAAEARIAELLGDAA